MNTALNEVQIESSASGKKENLSERTTLGQEEWHEEPREGGKRGQAERASERAREN